MNRWLAMAISMVAISIVSWAWAQEMDQDQEPSPVTKVHLPPYDNSMTIHYLTPGNEAVVTVIGDGGTAIGVYAYDAQGRCVAFDDETSPIIDDRAVAWRVVSPEPYEVHLRNFGSRFNRADVSFRAAP